MWEMLSPTSSSTVLSVLEAMLSELRSSDERWVAVQSTPDSGGDEVTLEVGDKVRIANPGSGFFGRSAIVVFVYPPSQPGNFNLFDIQLDIDDDPHSSSIKGTPFGFHEVEKIDD